MKFPRRFSMALLFTPLMLFPLASALPYCSARLSLVLNGLPFARVVPKESVDIFHYVETDSFAYQAVVYSGGKAVGMIEQPSGSPAYYQPFGQSRRSADREISFGLSVLAVWYWRWLLLPLQAILLLFWFRQRQRISRCCA